MHAVTAFLVVAVIVIVTPGPDTALTIRNTLLGGRRSGVFTAVGVAAGQATWTVATSVGAAALLVASEHVIRAVRYAGALYLAYLGLRAFCAAIRRRGEGAGVAPAATAPRLLPPIAMRVRLLEPALLGREEVTAALGPVARHLSLPLAMVDTGLRHLIVPCGSVGLPHRLIPEPDLSLAAVLGLPSFTASGRTYYRRLALVAESGVIAEVFDPVVAPGKNAAEIIAGLASRTDEGTTP
jgi:LysE type translocator